VKRTITRAMELDAHAQALRRMSFRRPTRRRLAHALQRSDRERRPTILSVEGRASMPSRSGSSRPIDRLDGTRRVPSERSAGAISAAKKTPGARDADLAPA
jgi:hypothetical protein